MKHANGQRAGASVYFRHMACSNQNDSCETVIDFSVLNIKKSVKFPLCLQQGTIITCSESNIKIVLLLY